MAVSARGVRVLVRPVRSLAAENRTAALLLAAAVFAAVQLATPDIIGIDGQYHIKVAALIREHGIRLDFPWLRYTVLNEAGYTDHHLLFHILQAPFTVFDLQVAAKLSTVVLSLASFWGVYLILERVGVRWPLAWLALLFAISPTFLWRHSMARPQSIAVLLIVAVFWATISRRPWWLIPLGFVSAWLFDGFVLPLVVPGAWLVAGLFVDREIRWKPLAFLLLGTAFGLVIHPYFPNNVSFAALHLLPKLGFGIPQEDIPVGAEWSPYSPERFVTRVGPSLAVMIGGLIPVLGQLWRRERLDPATLTLAFLAVGFLALLVRSQRIIEYFPAIAVLLAAWSWSATPLQLPARVRALFDGHWIWIQAAAVILLTVGVVVSVNAAQRSARAAGISARQESFREANAWLMANTAPGSLVFNIDWDDFPQLFFWNTHNVYVLGLDPTYMSIYDRELYDRWRSVRTGSAARPSQVIREHFGAEYVFSDTTRRAFLQKADADPNLEAVFRSETAVVFRLR